MKTKLFLVVFIVLTVLSANTYSQTARKDSISRTVDIAVRQIIKSQEPDGKWPYEGVYRVDGEIPVGYRIGGTAIVCQMLLYSSTGDNKPAETALFKGVDYILDGLNHPLMKPSTVDAYDVRVWGHGYALTLFCQLKKTGRTGSEDRAGKINSWILKLVKTLITEELTGGGWNYATRRAQATFVTGPITQALLWAKSLGEDVPNKIFERARDALLSSRYESGAFEYAGKKRSYDKPERNELPGSAARSALCESTLYLLGAGSTEKIKTAVDVFHKYWDELEKRRKKSGTHVPPYGIAPYYFYFGHFYASQAVELLKESIRAEERNRIIKQVLRTRDPDGTWNDRVFRRSHSYSTAMAVLSLISGKVPPPEAVFLK